MSRKQKITRPKPPRSISKHQQAEAARTLRIAARFLEGQLDELHYDGADCDHFCIAEECRSMAAALDNQDPALEDGCVCAKPQPGDEENDGEREGFCASCGGELADIPEEEEDEE